MEIDWTVIAVGVAIAGLILNGQWATGRRLDRLEASLADLRERVARLEGLFEGFAGARREAPSLD